MTSPDTQCRLCKQRSVAILYSGPIRNGGIRGPSADGYEIIECDHCKLVQLSPVPPGLTAFYETDSYRANWDETYSPTEIQKKYDHEQSERVSRIGVENLRDSTVLDLGAGPGLFLDAVKALTRKTLAVEPFSYYSEHLKTNGHIYYPYARNAVENNETANIVTCFDVIEHLENPKNIIDSASSLLEPGGSLFLSMPNVDDILCSLRSPSFLPFFFQTAHLNYFSGRSVPELFNGSGFVDLQIDYLHKYDFQNLVAWLKHGRPADLPEVNGLFDRPFDLHFGAELERLGLSSHLFVTARKRN